MPLLNLTEREDMGFDPLPAGRYRAKIEAAEQRETSGKGKLPAGTPMVNVQWQILEPLFEYPEIGIVDESISNEDKTYKVPNWENRRVFSSHTIPPEKIDGKKYDKYKMMMGLLYRFLEAIGYSEEELNSGNFELDYEDLVGREAQLTLKRREWTDPDTEEKLIQNDVASVKAAPASSGVL